jgi:hypothetical protein
MLQMQGAQILRSETYFLRVTFRLYVAMTKGEAQRSKWTRVPFRVFYEVVKEEKS